MSSVAMRTLHILCPSMRELGGHERSYTSGLIQAAEAVGIGARVHHPNDLEGAPFGEIGRHLDMPAELRGSQIATRLSNKVNRVRRSTAIRRSLALAGPDDAVFVHTAGFRDALSIASNARSRTGLLLRFDHYDRPDAVRALETIGEFARSGSVALFTDSRDLAEDFTARTGVEFTLAPPPASTVPKRTRLKSLVFGYLGGARPQKGFNKLPAVIAAVRSALPEAKFIIQAYAHSEDRSEDEMDATTREIEAIPGVELIRSVTTDEDHAALANKCDVVLTPYDRSVYRRVTSGVFVEGLVSGAAAVTQTGTWMAREAGRFGLERAVCIDFDDPKQIVDGARRALGSLDAPIPRTEEWAEVHSYKEVFDRFCGRMKWR
jgi:hypothetical protein